MPMSSHTTTEDDEKKFFKRIGVRYYYVANSLPLRKSSFIIASTHSDYQR
jgi:hypothetical protein